MNKMKKLIDAILQRAKIFIIKNGSFAPFGLYITKDEKIIDIIVDSKRADSKEIYEILLKGVEQDLQDENIIASAIVLNGFFKDKDVVVIDVYLSKEDRYQAIYPYSIKKSKVIFETSINR
jgi:hypothetical protein